MNKPDKAATETGRLLREWRGEMKLERAAVYAGDQLGREINREMVRKYEVERPEEDMDPALVGALLKIYKKRISDLPPYMAEKVSRVKGLFDTLVLDSSRLEESSLGGDSPTNRCIESFAA